MPLPARPARVDMFIGHYGPAFGLKTLGKPVALWVLFVAVQWLDIVWSVLVLAGIEKLRIVPGFTQASALDLYYMPYTHGLGGALALSLLLGAIVAGCMGAGRARVFLVIAAAAFSHWLLDLLVHVPDLPLYDNSLKVGLGLWRHFWISLPLELVFLGVGAWLYVRYVPAQRAHGDRWLWLYVVVLAAAEIYNAVAPTPTTPQAMAISALAAYGVLAVLAGVVERVRSGPRPAPAP
jgi:hypothetical protein